MFQKLSIPEADVYYLLSNDRRRETLSVLWDVADEMTLRELSEQIASTEANTTPAPRLLRESVYNTLHQTHLPKLATYGLVEYDADRKLVRSSTGSRSLARYMDTLTPAGVTWGEYYRALGIGGLFAVVASLAGMPAFGAVDPLLFASASLGLFALSTAYQLSGSVRSLLGSLHATVTRRRD